LTFPVNIQRIIHPKIVKEESTKKATSSTPKDLLIEFEIEKGKLPKKVSRRKCCPL